MVALAEYACSTAVFPTPPADCAVSRGVLFKPNESETWVPAGRYNINENGVGLEANLGYSQIADFALDRLALGLNGPTLDNQTVAGIGTASPFYLCVTLPQLLTRCSDINPAGMAAAYLDSTTSR
jgi:hypothetical protein